ncbi:MAG: trypsin-like peptidase domain-containing protein [Bacteroidales bacterium]|nr:trypsin-like peptidase domain-containing protein [Bacteroidales bacterium]
MKKNLKEIILIIILTFTGQNYLTAQINIGGTPIGFEKKYKTLIKQNIPVFSLPKLNNEQLLLEAELNETKDQPWQFGKNIDVNIDLMRQSAVNNISSGKLYRLTIHSEYALTINLRFSKYKLPKNAVLYIYNEDKTDIIGGFTSQNNQKNKIFATGLIRGDKITIEYFEPDDANFHAELVIDRITHGFRSISNYDKGFGHSGDCNMNVACDDGTWSNEIRSACMLVTGGSGFCSGALINNTLKDGTPYILTADHCYRDPSDMVFMFNWESETCDNPIVPPEHDDLSGAQLIARYSESDFCLFEMNDEPPYDYEVYYSGWNADDSPSDSSVCIHHPKGDIKKISYDDDPTVSDYYLGYSNPPDSHWKVIWDRNTTTENGSSGSPLFDENHRIIGQLHGGYASCSNLDEPDWYGKFSYSWDMGTTPETRLKNWLDPVNYGVTKLSGYDPNVPGYDNDTQILEIISPEDYYFDINTITPIFKIRNRGNNDLNSLTINYSIDNNTLQIKNWAGCLKTGEIEDISFNEVNLLNGEHSIMVYIENPNGTEDDCNYNDTLRKSFYIYDTIFEDDFETGNSWYLTGEFQIDEPMGLGGGTSYPDPTFAYSGVNILGTDLTGLGQHPGDYENNIGFNEEYAQSPVIDCTNFENTMLSFYRYIGIDSDKFDNVSIEINATDSSKTIWTNSSIQITDTIWMKQEFDISDIADGNKILIRFITGPTNHAEQYCGWNIDDLMVSGTSAGNYDTVMTSNIQIYPNPARNYFYIEINDIIENDAVVTISDISGKVIYNKVFSQQEIKTVETDYIRNLIIIENVTAHIGLYIVNIKTSTNSYSKKIALM